MQKYYLAVMICAAAVLMTGCGSKSSSSSSDSVPDTTHGSAASTTETAAVTKASTTSKVTETATTATASTEAASETETETTTVVSILTEPNEEAESVNEDCLQAANAFYQAYLDHDAEKVYSMFDRDEIDGFNEKMQPELGDASAKEVFRRAAVIRAIEDSMANIDGIMEYYADEKTDKWSFSLRAEDLDKVEDEELKEFNKSLGTSYTDAYICQYMFYNDDTNGSSFTGNSSAFVESGGKWYLSYSSVMGTDLLSFIDVGNIAAPEDETEDKE